jgi:GTP-binding protein LepA
VIDGEIAKNVQIMMLNTSAQGIALEVGALKPDMTPGPSLKAGEIGYIVTNLKTTRDAKVGDTITWLPTPPPLPCPATKTSSRLCTPAFSRSNEFYNELKDAIEKLTLSDSALQYAPGKLAGARFWRAHWFLGLLHMDIVRERLEREYNLDLVVTNPVTDYQISC